MDHKMEFKILRATRKVYRKLTTLDFRKADFGLLRDLPHSVSWNAALEGRGTQESWLVFKITFSKVRSDYPNKEEVRQKCH